MRVSAEVCKPFLEKQNPIFKWKQNLMPSSNQARSELLARPPRPQSSLSSIAETTSAHAGAAALPLTVRVLQHRAVLHEGHVPGPFRQAPAEENAVSLAGTELPEPSACPASTSGGLAWTWGGHGGPGRPALGVGASLASSPVK